MPTPSEIRRVAQSFGLDAARYDRTRPRYPDAMVQRITAALPGRDVLDVGTGTGIAARQFRDAGCRVLGVEPDDRMAEVARRHGIDVEISTFEAWEPAGRTFDGVLAGQTWHWVDPVVGAEQAARVLRPGGHIALFWNAFDPAPELAATFGEVYRRAAPSLPFDPWPANKADESDLPTNTTEPLSRNGAFDEPSLWTFDWEHTYTRAEWLDLVPTSGGHNLLPPAELTALLDGLSAVIGETVTIGYRTVVTTARAASRPGPSCPPDTPAAAPSPPSMPS